MIRWKIMFLLKKIIAPLFFPVSLSAELLLIGLVLLWFTKKTRAGKIFVTAGTLLLLVSGYGFISDRLVLPLEHHYPALLNVQTVTMPVKWIVVLGGGHTSDPNVPTTSQISNPSL